MTFFQSTIYIREDLLFMLEEAVDITKVNRSKLIEDLVVRYMEKHNGGEKIWEMSRNQKIDKEIKRKRICMFWRNDIYERSLDAKKAFKKSISYILALAIEKYIDEIIDEILDTGAAYKYNEYYLMITRYWFNTYISITVWGDPGPEIGNKLLTL